MSVPTSRSDREPDPQPTPQPDGQSRVRLARLVALAAGVVGLLLCLLTPLLPVKQATAGLDWPQARPGATSADVTASLVTQSPANFTATVPCSVLTELAAKGGVALSTLPIGTSQARELGLSVSVGAPGPAQSVTVASRNAVIAAAPMDRLRGCAQLQVWSNPAEVGARFEGTDVSGTTATENRPVMGGVFTDLTPAQVAAAGPGLRAHAEIDTRFELAPSPVKALAIALGLLCVLASLIALWLLDRGYGYHRRAPSRGWKQILRPRPVDVAVVGGLVLWTFLGGGGSDDGYILSMGKVASEAGYTPNYYRFFGAPEAPFDWYYSFLAQWGSISANALWMRIPALLAGIAVWFLLSRVLLPRLGPGIRRYPVATWTAGAMLLAFWFPMNSGLRSEPIIVLGTIVTWAAVERAVATRRLLPAAIAALAAGMTLGLAPQGVVAVALLLASSAAVLRVIVARRNEAGIAALVLPILAAGAVIVPIAFRDQSLASVAEAIRIRLEVGPVAPWTQEYLRYFFLTVETTDGSLVRRVPVYLFIMCLFVALFVMLRSKRIPRIDPGPVWRLVGAVFIGAALLSLTPTKWTIHFGVYAGLAAALAAVTTVAVVEAARTSVRNFTFFLCGMLFALAAAFAGFNLWPWPYPWGVPWFDRQPEVAGLTFSTVFRDLAFVAGALAAWQHFRMDFRRRGEGGLADGDLVNADDAELATHTQAEQDGARRARRRLQLASLPLVVVLGLLVLGEGAIFAKAMVSNPSTYTVAKGNLDTLRGDSCGMAEKVLVETDPSSDLLPSAEGRPAAQALTGSASHGFLPDGLPDELKPLAISSAPGQINMASPITQPFTSTAATAGTGGGRGPRTINGSTAALPFGLDPARTPVVGSYGQNTVPAELFSDWYTLPARSADRPLVAFAASGAISSVGPTGKKEYGQPVTLEWAERRPDGSLGAQGVLDPIDPGPNKPWRNLRVPMDAIPPTANVVRIHVRDPNLGEQQWVAVTPPRAPRLRTLQDVVGKQDPVLLDLLVGQQFPCQRPMAIRNGTYEVPKWRILPTRKDALSTSSAWQAREAGGLLTVPDTLLRTTTLPTFMTGDLTRDWGELQQYTPIAADAPAADLTVGTQTRSGLWREGPIRALTNQTVRN
ncbi:arabinosyltransferase domain-containing protein [Tsukamurella strandjordii]|uniref:Arabinosyltransferase domain-containing protein n=1 Tax=Tsukamurella strandjordii TaxID=147577 RepID=A0AA90NC80_9ACTN|nr:arabinosyltransferase domain-containing protein [Tsukamurella strandjordii]MDP0399706.1 arabinosyltransferase domain-containing protein [Tsukamurella strandjordii]